MMLRRTVALLVNEKRANNWPVSLDNLFFLLSKQRTNQIEPK